MNTALWIVAGLLAAAFLVAGSNKLLFSREKLAKAPGGGWALDFSAGFVRTLGVLEILAAAGLILPRLLGIATFLLPMAALGLVVLMTGAAIVVSRRREFAHLAIDLTYLALAAFLAIGRLI
jgi:uncharacterized membrane protein